MAEQWLWLINVVSFVICLAFNSVGGSGALWGDSIGEISDNYNTYLTPDGAAFGIWGIIYLFVSGFVIFQAIPANRNSKPVVLIGHLFWVSCLLNASWIIIFTEGSKAAIYMSSLVIGSLLFVLLAIYERARLWTGDRASYAELVLCDVTFSIYAGWVTVATILSVAMDILAAGYDGGGSGDSWACGMLSVALCIFLYVGITRRDPVYVGVLAWASYWIAKKPDSDLNTSVLRACAYAVSAACAVVSIALVAVKVTSAQENRRVGRNTGGGIGGILP